MKLLLFGTDNSVVETLFSQTGNSILKRSVASLVLIKINTFHNIIVLRNEF